MKKLLTFLFAAFAMSAAFAQTDTIIVLTPPCHNNGVLRVATTGFTGPVTFTYYSTTSTIATHIQLTSTSDTLTGWPGGYVWVSAVDSTTHVAAYTSYVGGPFTFTANCTSAVCPALGTLGVTVSGGSGGYTYSWYSSTGTFVGSSNPQSAAPGAYYLIASDGSGCSMDSRYALDSGFYLNSLPSFFLNVNTTTASCTNGSASVTSISGGTSPYTYLWSNGATSSSITGLTQGTYSVAVTDSRGCTADSTYIMVNQYPFINAMITATPATCLDTDGAVIAFGSGGVSPYTYSWSNGSTTQSQTGLASGSYNVIATDANGCTGQGYSYVNVSTPITVTYATTPSSCTSPTGSATLTLSGGTSPYTVTWYTSPVQTGVTANHLTYGNYYFEAVDAAGCRQSGTVTIPPVDVVDGYFSAVQPTCTSATGRLGITTTSGAAPFSYAWTTGATTTGISGITAGYYQVAITDHNGCTATKCYNLFATSPVTVGFSSTIASCILSNDGVLSAIPHGGTAPYRYYWNTGATASTLTGLPHGVYRVDVVDTMGCTAGDTVTLGYNDTTDFCYCSIEGTVYNDVNGNCTQDYGEPGINNIQIHCSGIGYTYTDTSGHYQFKVPTGSYTVSQNVLAYYPLSTCQSNNISVSVTAASGCVHPVNFADTLNPIHDMHISTWDYSFAIPGNTYTQVSILSNEGTVTENNIYEGYQADGQLLTASFTPTGSLSTSGGNFYRSSGTLNTLVPGNSQRLLTDYNVPTNIPLGTSVLFKDTLTYVAPATNWLTDYSPWNNVNYFTTNVVASHDPNFKEVKPKGYGPQGIITYADSTLEYMIHFQNTGTWNAQNIVVIDTLDRDLDWTTLRPVYMSHKGQVEISETGVATFTFKNINLPAKIYNEGASNGMFTYTVKTRRNLPVGTQFTNNAAIYFDYNAPIYTNTTTNVLGWPESVPTVTHTEKASFELYPNPAKNSFNVVVNSDQNTSYTIRVADITGRQVAQKSESVLPGRQTITVETSSLPAGVYLVSLIDGEKTMTQKLVILK